jgi:hypothetical protein
MPAHKPCAAALLFLLAGSVASAAPETLDRFFPPEQVEAARGYSRLATASTSRAEGVLALYRRAVELSEELFAPIHAAHPERIWPRLEEFLDADLDLPGLSAGCVAECTEPALILDVGFFAEKAAATKDGADDAFFELVEAFYGAQVPAAGGRVAGWPAFVEQTWDYGGHSLLGSGVHLRLLELAEPLRRSSRPFAEAAEPMREAVMDDLLSSDCLGLPAAEGVAEISRILEAIPLSDDERQALTGRRRELADPAAHDIEVDCRQASCACNSG